VVLNLSIRRMGQLGVGENGFITTEATGTILSVYHETTLNPEGERDSIEGKKRENHGALVTGNRPGKKRTGG